MSGESVWPKKWQDTIQEVNLIEIDLSKMLDDLLEVALKDGTVQKDKITS